MNVVVVTGQPGVGKSTVCARLAQSREFAAHVKADDLQRMIVSGGHWPSAGTEVALRQLVTRTRNAAQVAANIAAAGADVFLDEVVALQAQLDIIDSYVGPAHWIVLTASPTAILERDASRAKHTAAQYFDVAAELQALLANRATFIDTDELHPEGVAERIQVTLGKRERQS